MSNLRYGHSEGHTDICYSDNFKYIVTCGSEGDVRIWNGVDDADQKDNCVGEKAWAVFQREANLYVATDTNIVQAYTFPDFETDGLITRFTAPATQIVVSSEGSKLVASSCDMDIHVVDINNRQCKKLIGHKAPVLSVSIDLKCEFVASSSCDGSVRIWAIDSGNVVHQWKDVVPKSNSFENSSTICRLDFDPRGQALAVPQENAVKLYKRETWSLTTTLITSSSGEVVNIVKFSPCGKFIVGGTTTGTLYIWSVDSTVIISKRETEKSAICGVAWCKSRSIAFVNTNGQLGSLDVPNISHHLDDQDEKVTDLDNVPLGVPELVDDDDEDDENVISLEKIKSGYIVENGEVFKKEASPNIPDDFEERASVMSESILRPKIHTSDVQPPFQPTSTPVHLQQRFMAWNIDVGIVRQFNFDDMNDIDVEFHDTSHHPAIRMNNLLGHTMACLTADVLVLAAPKMDDTPSKLVCVMLKTRGGTKEWDVSFDDEELLLLAGGNGWVAAVTDLPALHIFSADGNQTDIISLPGRPVTMAGFRDQLAVFVHTGVGLNGDQHMSCCQFRVSPGTRRAVCYNTRPLPLSVRSTLRWAGFTTEGSLATFDFAGVVRLLYRNTWRPISFLDKQCKSEFDHYFLLGISEYSQNISCILCKGAYYPPVMPKPLVTEVKWKMPLCEMDSDKAKLEEEFLRTTISLPNIPFNTFPSGDEEKQKMEKTISVGVVKLFALACRSDLDSRALSICEAMPTPDVVRLAAKYAAKLGKTNLSEKVNDIANRMSFISPQEEIENEESYEAEQSQERSVPQTNAYSQDMFEDSETSKENLIINMKKKKAALSPKPLRMRRTGNPFKKSKDSDSSSQGDEGTAMNKLKFMDWYDSNRSRLQEEFPLLKEGELILASMKLYRQELNAKSNMNETLKASLNETISSPYNPKKKVEDLSTTTMLGETQDEIIRKEEINGKEEISGKDSGESKKRKNSSEESGPAKKLSASSKLKNFSFSKR